MVGDVLNTLRPIELQEYGTPVDCDADRIDLSILALVNSRWVRALKLDKDPIRVEKLGSGRLRLRAEGVTGVVRVGETDIQIAPKFLNAALGSWQMVLWRILAVVEGGFVDEDFTSAHEIDSISIPDLLAEMFLASYARGAARGLPRSYQTEAGSGVVLRGALDIGRIGQWIARPWELPYVADLLTDDTPLARLLRWAAECLAATVTSPGRARALREVASTLSIVGPLPPHLFDAQRISLGTQHQGLEPARIVGLLMLEGAGVHHAEGNHALSGFLWNSDVIYENYVFWLCQRAAGRSNSKTHKDLIKFGKVVSGTGKPLVTTPDVVFSDAGRNTIAVMDAKYKRFGAKPKASDTYQVLTAAHVLGCQRVSLIYPVDHPAPKTVWRVHSELGGKDIEMTALPLNLMALVDTHGALTLVDVICDWLVSSIATVYSDSLPSAPSQVSVSHSAGLPANSAVEAE